MRFSAQVQASIEILDGFFGTFTPMDRILKVWANSNRYAGSSDRRKIADIVYESLRNKRSLSWLAGGGTSGHSILYGYCLKYDLPVKDIFTGEGHAPPQISADMVAQSLDDAPYNVRYDIPDWIPSIGEDDLRCLSLDRAPIDIRVNVQKSTVEQARLALEEDGIQTAAIKHCSTGLRVKAGFKVISSTPYQNGLIELQDASSQMAMLAMPEGESVLDFCAGGGGKALALAALGRTVTAYDLESARMKDLPARAERAGISLEISTLKNLQGRKFPVVLVDAPCSGSGTWRRTPAEKWRLTPERFEDLKELQVDILKQAAQYAKPGGFLVYCTCSVFDIENMGSVENFEAFMPTAHRVKTHYWTPSSDDCDGFFQCIWKLG